MKFKALMVIFLAFLLTGCESESFNDGNHTRYFKAISSERDGQIVYDTRTGVQYWMPYDYSETLTVLVDAEGKPLIYNGSEKE